MLLTYEYAVHLLRELLSHRLRYCTMQVLGTNDTEVQKKFDKLMEDFKSLQLIKEVIHDKTMLSRRILDSCCVRDSK